ncbi:MAG: gluconate:H+ symporter [Saprospiraceae bacterium]
MPLLIISIGILLLLLLISIWKINGFISFILVSLFVGLAQGLSLENTVKALERGMGETLGSLVLILGFGAMLGKLVADSGAAQHITISLVRIFGRQRVQIALMLAGFLVGIPLFYAVGFVILVPLVFTVAATLNLPLLYVALPMLASLSVTHGFLPPHPAPTAISQLFGADLGLTMLYGFIVAVPAILIAGLGLSKLLPKVESHPLAEFVGKAPLPEKELPSTFLSILCALMPVILIGAASVAPLVFPAGSSVLAFLKAIGIPAVAMLIAVLFALYFLAIRRDKKMEDIMKDLGQAVASITMVMLIIAGAGGLKEVLVESKVADYLGALLANSAISPLVLAWMTAALIRIAVGSATVAGLTAAGIMLPLVGQGTSPELLTLAIGAGSITLSHVNDGGFWLFKEYFNLSVKETLQTWTVMETSISVIGMVSILILNQFI